MPVRAERIALSRPAAAARRLPLLVGILAACLLASSAARAQMLPRSTPETQGVSSARVLAFVEAADTGIDAMNSFMLVRHGYVVAEGWWRPYAAGTPHMLYSLSKSFTSTAVGLAIAEGKLSLDGPVLNFFPDQAPAQPSANLRAMRVRDLLRMTTGQETEPALWLHPDAAHGETWVQGFLAQAVPFKPGTHFLYDTQGTYVLSAIVQKVTGRTVLDFLGPRLFAPLGIDHPTWTTSPEGISAGGIGLSVRTEDLARFGELYLRRGRWNGRQLVPAAWIDSATARQTSNGSDPASDWDQGYGFQFWRCRHGAYRGDGAFGQYVIVLPKQDAVVVITSGVRDMQAVLNLVWDRLLPALSTHALPNDDTARRALRAKLASLAVRTPVGRDSSPLAASVSRRWYRLTSNERGIGAVALDFGSPTAALLVRTASGETRTPIGRRAWLTTSAGFANGIERFVTAPEHPVIAASGAWTSDSTFTVKLVAPETPYYSTLDFRFSAGGGRLLLDSGYNVSFGRTALPELEGTPAPSSIPGRS